MQEWQPSFFVKVLSFKESWSHHMLSKQVHELIMKHRNAILYN